MDYTGGRAPTTLDIVGMVFGGTALAISNTSANCYDRWLLIDNMAKGSEISFWLSENQPQN